MSEHAQEVILYILGLSLTIIPLLRELYRVFKPAPSIRKPKAYLCFLLCAGVGLIWLGILKINRDSVQKATDNRSADSLRANIRSLITDRKQDSVENAKFLVSL